MAFRVTMGMADVAPPINPDLKIVHVAGDSKCPFFRKARDVVNALSILFPAKYKLIVHEFPTRDEFRAFIADRKVQLADARAHRHTSSPFVCFGADFENDPATCTYLGGGDDVVAFAQKLFSGGADAAPLATMAGDGFATPNEYDYDLVVIGGGSGGLAASKEAAKLGARVAVLDYVKPSTQGTRWGLGGTCVNVGCIPKKLMHQASILGELINHDAPHFGWGPAGAAADGSSTVASAPLVQHSWDVMVGEVQRYIKSLNFKYRVALRDANVKYINGLGELLSDHEIKVTEFKGKDKTPKEKTITTARVLIATGGRPTPLACPGGEHAITSDDLFSLPNAPGKTCVIGAGYVSLECGGFLTALGFDTTILVRSILLRGFDRECCDKIGAYMQKQGTKIVMGVTPSSIEKMPDGKLRVTYSDGNSDVFDTVLAAVGRTADTAGLNLAAAGVVASKNGKFETEFEQTNVPNVYAIGDVLLGKPELTPIAIQAGILLARRLFGSSSEAMDYKNVATAVFTPLEYGAVGLSEEEAIAKYGEAGVEVYHAPFVPLEWSLTPERETDAFPCFCKIICNKGESEKVLGMHYLGPNAGEVIQGYGAAVKRGVTYQDIMDTVGIHPTTAEVFTTLTVTKSSGQAVDVAGC
eukprot:CAMPEP_0118967484 /NCGR_PEP_ID=MMETSP1173-20130426/4858_1 /TAXON_ID=1034831 /ORGANISM="Rhizochromulina marina cf, Strain CCMP1243" /LENGTH=640 /DNA_ID=CAMNT_0006916455 /DNA_START=61 /DNA_END=1983 /DNA_ORIENTATION=-